MVLLFLNKFTFEESKSQSLSETSSLICQMRRKGNSQNQKYHTTGTILKTKPGPGSGTTFVIYSDMDELCAN